MAYTYGTFCLYKPDFTNNGTEMSTESSADGLKPNISTTNFDTYTLILQLGCILNTVPAWKKAYKLRVAVFVEFESDVDEERARVTKLLNNLRIQAEILVIWLASGELQTYEVIVRGMSSEASAEVDGLLGRETWWEELKSFRKENLRSGTPTTNTDIAQLITDTPWPSSSYHQQGRSEMSSMSEKLKKLLKRTGRRQSVSGLARLGVPLPTNMRSQPLNQDLPSELSSDWDSEGEVSEDSKEEDEASGLLDRVGRSYGTNESHAQGTDESASSRGPELEQQRSPGSQDSTDFLVPPKSTRGPLSSRPSTPHFSCTAIPDTQILSDEGTGPTIRFADDTASGTFPARSTPGHSTTYRKPSLSFNDVPSRGQHIILNELLNKYSQNTAVIFTTLPSPTPGTCKSEQDSLDYLLDLEAGLSVAFGL